jgi:hypothetical protein
MACPEMGAPLFRRYVYQGVCFVTQR